MKMGCALSQFSILVVFLAALAIGSAPDALAAELLVSGKDASGLTGVLRYDATTGVFLGSLVPGGSGGLNDAHGLAFGPDGNLYVASDNTGSVLRYNGTTGAFIDTFIPFGHGGLTKVDGLVFGPDGNLYVSSRFTEVKRYHGTTGAFMDDFAAGHGLNGSSGVIFGPDGRLYVSSVPTNNVLRFDGATGTFIDVFASGGGLDAPQGLVFGSDGNLYVSSFGTDSILRYHGTTAAFIDAFVPPGSGGLDEPWGLVFGPDGNLYVSSHATDSVLRYDGGTGSFVDTFASIGLHGDPSYTYLTFTGQPLPPFPRPVPEPASVWLLLIGSLAGVAAMGRRRARRRSSHSGSDSIRGWAATPAVHRWRRMTQGRCGLLLVHRTTLAFARPAGLTRRPEE